MNKRLEPVRDEPFSTPEMSEKNTAARVNRIRHYRTGGQFRLQRFGQDSGRNFKQFLRLNEQLILGQAAVAIRHRLRQSIGNPCPRPDHRRPRDPEPLGNQIGRFEANAA